MTDVYKEPNGDFNIELGLLCTGDDEDKELHDMNGPQCWHGIDANPGRFV